MLNIARSFTPILLSLHKVLNLSERRDADRSRTQSVLSGTGSKVRPRNRIRSWSRLKKNPALQQVSYSIGKCTNCVTVFYYTLIDWVHLYCLGPSQTTGPQDPGPLGEPEPPLTKSWLRHCFRADSPINIAKYFFLLEDIFSHFCGL